jgi:Zn finger protein HypA/HybF involved in hydrogenase expression
MQGLPRREEIMSKAKNALFAGCLLLLAMPPLAAAAGRNTPEATVAPRPDNPHGSYVEECSLCHGAYSWKPAQVSRKFNHARFGFRLAGAHAQASCRSCHLSLEFASARPKRDCVSCHQDVHRSEFGSDCSRCHTAWSFIDDARQRRMHALTRFPLSGAHLALDCGDCHAPAGQGHLQYVGTRARCVDCHQRDFDATTDPNHVTDNFPRDCLGCHNTLAFRPARGDP